MDLVEFNTKTANLQAARAWYLAPLDISPGDPPKFYFRVQAELQDLELKELNLTLARGHYPITHPADLAHQPGLHVLRIQYGDIDKWVALELPATRADLVDIPTTETVWH